MKQRFRNRAIIIMVLIQFAISISALVLLSPITFAPSNTVSEQRIIVLPVYSSDSIPSTSIGVIQTRMQNVASYFEECSYSAVSVSSSVLGWVRLDAPMDSYANPWSIGGVEHGGVTEQIFVEAISKVDAEVDFSQYDRLIVVHAGESGQDSDGNYTKIGTCHRDGWFATGDGRVFLEASIVSEYDEFGTIAHELGHGFGAPDLYDYHSNYSAWTGIGRWGLMNTGNHNGNPSGTKPSHMCIYNKHLLGWVNNREILTIQNESLTVDLIPVSIQNDGYRAIRYDLNNGLYYLVEARSQTGYDAGLSGSGVLVMLVNETRLSERRDGVQLQIPIYAKGLYDAFLRSGEAYYDSDNGFSVRVTEFREDIVTVDVSTNPVEEWIASERIQFTEDIDIRDIYVTTTTNDIYPYVVSFAAVFIESDYENSIQVFSTNNQGRDWEFVFDTNETDYSLYTWGFSFNYYQGMLMLTGMISGPEDYFLGNLGYTINTGSFSVVNFTDIVNYYHYEAVAIASPDAFYICCESRINSTSGITYFKLSETGWASTFMPVPELIEIQVSNVPNDGEEPYVLYRDGYHHLRLTHFNDTSIIYNVTAEYDGVWNIDIICSVDTIALSYIDSLEDSSLNVYYVEVGSVLEGFSKVVVINRTEYVRPISLSYSNLTDIFHVVVSISGDMQYLEIADAISANKSIEIDGASPSCFLPRVDYSNSQLKLIRMRARDGIYSIASITLIHVPDNPERAEVYFYRSVSGLLFPIYVIPIALLGAIIAMYFILDSNAAMKFSDNSIIRKLGNFKNGLTSLYLDWTARIQPFFLNPLVLGANVILSIAIFHLVMQLPLIGSGVSLILHNLRIFNFFDLGSLLILIGLLTSFLIYLVRLEKPYFYVKYIIWSVTLVVIIYSSIGWNIGLLLTILTFTIWTPLWCFTSLEIIQTRSDRLLKVAANSLSSIANSKTDRQLVSSIMDSLEHLRKKNSKILNDALNDEVLFSRNLSTISDSVYDILEELQENDKLFSDVVTQLKNYRKIDERSA